MLDRLFSFDSMRFLGATNVDNVIGLVLAIGILVFLLIVLIFPEKF